MRIVNKILSLRYFTIFILTFLLSRNLAFSQKENEIDPNGYSRIYYGNGQISSEGPMRNGQPDGYWKTFYVTGALKSEGNRKNFKLDSTWIFYTETGDTIEKINYRYGIKNGYQYTFQIPEDNIQTNCIIAKELYLEGQKQGKSYYYYDNGSLWKIINYEDGRREGDGTEYSRDSIIITLLKFRNNYLIDEEPINRRDKNGWKQGIWKTFHDNERLKLDCEYKNDTLHGYYRRFSESGKLLENLRYINGELYVEKKAIEGEERSIEVRLDQYPNGKIKSRGSFVGSIPIGIHREFSPEGKVIGTKEFDDKGNLMGEGINDISGKRQGYWEFFYPTGELKAKGNYENDNRVGEWIFYFKNGKVEQTGHYKKGKFEGKWIWYYENGEILREEEYLMGFREGHSVEYNEEGLVIAEGDYIEGMKTGKWKYLDGDEKEEGSYQNDSRNGMWRKYYADGTLKFKGQFVRGFPDGKHKFYHENGKIKEEGRYIMGRKHKIWRTYDETGKILLTITYKNGEEKKIDGMRVR